MGLAGSRKLGILAGRVGSGHDFHKSSQVPKFGLACNSAGKKMASSALQ